MQNDQHDRLIDWFQQQWMYHTEEQSPALSAEDLEVYLKANYEQKTLGWIYVVDPKLSIPQYLRQRNSDGSMPSFAFQTEFEQAESTWNTAWPITPDNIIARFATFTDRIMYTLTSRMIEMGKDKTKYLYAWGK